MHTKLTVCALLALAAGAHAQPTYTEDFESFNIAPINQQQGWFSLAENDARVVETAPDNRSARYQLTPVSYEDGRQEWSLVGAPFDAAYGRLDLDVLVDAGDPADHDEENRHHIATEDLATGFLNARVELTRSGQVNVMNPTTRDFETVASFTPGVTVRVAIETTPAGVARVYLNDDLVSEQTEITAAQLGAQRSGKTGRLVVWSSTRSAFNPEDFDAFSIEIDNLSFTPAACQADFDADGAVGAYELSVVLARWKSGWPGGPADLNADGVIDATDLSQVIAAWGACAE